MCGMASQESKERVAVIACCVGREAAPWCYYNILSSLAEEHTHPADIPFAGYQDDWKMGISTWCLAVAIRTFA